MNKKIVYQIFLFIFVALLVILSFLKYEEFFSGFENRLNDAMFVFRGQKSADPNIVIVDIDEKSLQELGQWPWSRDIVAQILNNLTKLNVGIIGLDIVFAEEDRSSPKKILERLKIKYKDAPDYDEILAKTIRKTPTILGYVFSMSDDNISSRSSLQTRAIVVEKSKPKESNFFIEAYRAILNIPMIQNAAFSSGYFNTIPDSDGVVRSVPLLIKYNGMLYPSLSLEMIRVALGIKKIVVNYSNIGIESIDLGGVSIPTDRFGRLIINYAGRAGAYNYISMSDVFFNRVDLKDIEGKIVIIGTSAAGLLDLRSTPFDSVFPGVEVHANAIDNIINANFIYKPSWILGVNVVSIFISLAVVFLISLVPNAIVSFVLFLIAVIGMLLIHYYEMFYEGIILNTIFPLFGISILFLLMQVINYFFEVRLKNQIKKKFATKVSPAVVDDLIKNGDSKSLEVKEKEITIFFSDIRSFTTISEKMNSAKELVKLLNDYLDPMVDIITKHRGTVDKFIGDSIMAYWNAPIDTKEHADKALISSVEQIVELNKLNEKFKSEKRPIIEIGIGLNSGVSVIGEMGSFGRSDYTCIGDPVNLASRAEGLCKVYGAKIILTEFTKKLLKEKDYKIRFLDRVKVKGKNEAVLLYECFGYKDKCWLDFYDENKYGEAVSLYKNMKFLDAQKLFLELFEQSPQKLYEVYLQRCDYFIENPPKKFDGTFVYETK